MSKRGVQIAVRWKGEKTMFTLGWERLVDQNSRCLISDGAIDMIPAADDPTIDDFSIDSVRYRVWPAPQSSQRVPGSRENQRLVAPFNELP